MFVSKEEAKKMIDAAPGKIWIDSFSGITFIHTKPKAISRDEGKRIINKASTIDYMDNDFFDGNKRVGAKQWTQSVLKSR